MTCPPASMQASFKTYLCLKSTHSNGLIKQNITSSFVQLNSTRLEWFIFKYQNANFSPYEIICLSMNVFPDLNIPCV